MKINGSTVIEMPLKQGDCLFSHDLRRLTTLAQRREPAPHILIFDRQKEAGAGAGGNCANGFQMQINAETPKR